MSKFSDKILDDYVVVDLETTGLSPERDEIIEIAAVRVRDNVPSEVFQTFVNPRRHISSAITSLTGINDDMVIDAPLIGEAMPKFLEFAGDTPLLGHNLIRFDLCFLQMRGTVYNYCIDTLDIAHHIKTGTCGYSLSALCARFGVINDNAHRALSDCIATHEVYQALKRLYNVRGAFFTMAASCSKKEFQKNISERCRVGTMLTYSENEKGGITLFKDEYPVGTVCGGKLRELEDNKELIKGIRISKITRGAQDKLLMGTEVELCPKK